VDKDIAAIVQDHAATLFCMGQDRQKGDGSALDVDKVVDEATSALTQLFEKKLSAAQIALLEEIKQDRTLTNITNRINQLRSK